MTGLEKIIAQIQQDGEADCAKVLQTAKQQAAEIAERGRQEADRAYKAATENAAALYASATARAQSAAEALQKRQLLTAKSQLIEQTLAAAEAQLNALSGEDYFKALQKLLQKYRTGQPGEVLLSRQDYETLAQQLLAPYPELTAKAANLKNGFILCYGGIEQNCTFAALLQSRRDDLKDSLATALFA